MKYWHFLPDDGCLRYGNHEKVKVKHTLMHPPDFEPVLCKKGFHASKRAIDALQYAPGSLVCLVTLHGKIVHDDDKVVAHGRTVLAMADATNVLHEMACRCAENALKLIKNPDPRSVAAIEAKRKWLRGEITNDELSAARSAAESAAWSATRLAAESAAWSAAWLAARLAAESAQNTMLESMLHELLETNP